MEYKSLLITGPTSVGKTNIAKEIANVLNGDLINSDKFHLYSGFNIGSGILDSGYAKNISSHLYGVLKPKDTLWSTSIYTEAAIVEIKTLLAKGRIPIIEGCSFSYNEALVKYFENNSIVNHLNIGIKWSSDVWFVERIRCRVVNMFSLDLLTEVTTLLNDGFKDSYVMKKGVIYKYAIEHVNGKLSLEDAIDLIVEHIFLFAKYQLKRYRLLENIVWFDANECSSKEIISGILGIFTDNTAE